MLYVLLLIIASILLCGAWAGFVNLDDKWLVRRGRRTREQHGLEERVRHLTAERDALRERVVQLEEEAELAEAHERFNEEAREARARRASL